MILWKVRSLRMRALCKLSKCFLLACLCISLFPLSACQTNVTDTLTLEEWIHELDEYAGITNFEETKPYFINISENDACFSDVQAAVEWQVLDVSFGFDPDKILNNEWVAYTLMNLAQKEQDESLNIKDIADSTFKKQIQSAVSSGLMHVDDRNMFHPESIIEKQEAVDLLEKTVSYINHRDITETKTNIEWKKNEPIEVEPITFDEENLILETDGNTMYEGGEIVHFNYGLEDLYYEVISQDDTMLYLKDINILEKTDSMELSGSEELDFTNATIIDGEGDVVQETTDTNRLENVSYRNYEKSFNIGDFHVAITTTSTNVKAEVSRLLPYGASAYASIKINGVKLDYAWNSKEENLSDAYFKVNFNSNENIGLKNGEYKNLYGDFSQYNADDFLSSLTTMFKEKKDVLESTLTLCEIKVPIPNAPILNVSLSLELHMYVSGKVELSLSQDNSVGLEVRDGKLRFIKDMTHEETNRAKATTEARTSVLFGLNLVALRLMDVGVNASAKFSLATQLHLYKDGEHRILETEVTSDVASELSDDNPNVLVCSNVNADLAIYLKVNSSKSQLGKFGLSGRLDLLKISLLPSGKKHMENFMFVSKCTRKDRVTLSKTETIEVSKKIKLQDYSMVVRVGKNRNIVILGLPEGYRESDLLYESDNESIAQVDESGNVFGVASGAAVITVKTKDGEHYIKCNVLVAEVKP